jgi:organic hydroperoxide reductase OsmC/OhrA
VSEARHVPLDAARMTVSAGFTMQGSIVAGTATHRLAELATTLEIQSTAEQDEITPLVEQAERMCFVMDAVQRPHEIRRRVMLNGEAI